MKKIILFISVLLMWVGGAFAAAWTGSTSEPENTKKIDGKSFYVISTADEFAWFAAQVNAGKTTINGVLGNDIVFGSSTTETCSKEWTPIGTNKNRFNGIFDGSGYKVYGIKAVSTSGSEEGIFGSVGANGYVRNLTLASGAVSTCGWAGGIAAANYGHIENCENMVSVQSRTYSGGGHGDVAIGGIVGWNEGFVLRCSNSGAISSKEDGSVGGIVGNHNAGSVSNCTNSGSVSSGYLGDASQSSGHGSVAGGIVGSSGTSAVVELCKNSGAISNNTCMYVGGIVAQSLGTISNCYNTSTVSSTVWYGGGYQACGRGNGITPFSNTTIKNSYDVKSLKYWLNNKEVQGTSDAMQKDQFAWILNTSNGAAKNSGVWTRGSTGYPVFATSSSLAICRITFSDDGSTSNRYTNYQGKVSFPSDPEASTGYTFSGWYNGSGAKVTSSTVFTADQTVNAKYTRYYTIKFFNGDTLLQTLSVASGTTPAYTGSTPTKATTAQYTYAFNGWNPAIAAASKDISYQAAFTSTLRSYTIAFKDYNGTSLQSSAVNYGVTPTYSKTPTRASTAEWKYTFKGWTPTVVSVTKAATYTAVYDSSKVQYAITFNNYDGTKLSTVNVNYGSIPSYSGTPTRTGSAEWKYTFKGWTPTVVSVTKAATYTAVYDSTTAEYVVSFKDYDGKVLQSTTLKYGAMPTTPSAPSRKATAEWNYSFAGWNKEIASVVGAVEYVALYDSTKNSYEVKFVDFDGVEIQKNTLDYGEIPVCSNNPARESTAEWNYEFKGWTPAITNVAGAITYKAVYDSVKVGYTVVLKSDGSVERTENIVYGETFTVPRGSTKDGHTFVGWYVGDDMLGNVGDVIVVTQNIVADAKYTVNSYVVKFLDFDGTVLKKDSYEYGSIPVYGSAVSREATDEWNYEFIGWTPSIGKVTKAVSYTATYDSTKVKYEVVFMNGSVEYDAQEVEYGASAEKPSDPKKSGYTFVGWNKDFSNVTENMVVEALFEKEAASSSSKVPESSSSSVVPESSSSSVNGDDSSSSSKNDAIIASAQHPQFRATVVGHSILIAGARVGSAYAVLDMQGSVLNIGRTTSANFAVKMPSAGSYLLRIENQVQRVNVK